MKKKAHSSSWLAIYDVSGIQEYIFASNRLRENVGASRIVSNILKEYLPEVIEEAAKVHQPNLKVITQWHDDNNTPLKAEIVNDPTVDAEIVYIGGGSAIVAFRNIKFYNEVNKQFAKRIIETTYTLSLAVTEIETDFDCFVTDRENLEKKLQEVKARMLRQRPFGAFPISEQEGFSGFPITAADKQSTVQYLKNEASKAEEKDSGSKRKTRQAEANQTFKLPEALSNTHRWAFDMRELVREHGEDGYVAILHIDGNGMGEQMKYIMTSWKKEKKNYTEAIGSMRKLSLDISTGYRDQFNKVLEREFSCREKLDSLSDLSILPIRPLIMDGDDLTFICKAELGIPLAAAFLRELDASSGSEESSISLSACAGVALVHSHFPFSLAYEIAEECCASAKKKRHFERADTKKAQRQSYLDFHVVRGSYVRQLEDIRSSVSDHSGTPGQIGRPYAVEPTADCVENAADSYTFLEDAVRRIQHTKEKGAWPRTWLNRLYETYSEGGDLDDLKDELNSRGYQIQSLYDSQALGQENVPDRLIMDALEIADMHKLQHEQNMPSQSEVHR